MAGTVSKHSYTVPCASAFRDAVEVLAARRAVNVGDLARSILLVVPAETVAAFPDPGEPAADDREAVVLKSGPAAGRPWRRKPRLQVRLPPGYEISFIRRALGLALAIDRGSTTVYVGGDRRKNARGKADDPSARLAEANDELERLRAVVAVLAFEPLAHGVRSREEALHVLGFPPAAVPDARQLRAKFRMLATIHHPDSLYGSNLRMSQLNQAMELLRNGRG
jgi:hypothetical protein